MFVIYKIIQSLQYDNMLITYFLLKVVHHQMHEDSVLSKKCCPITSNSQGSQYTTSFFIIFVLPVCPTQVYVGFVLFKIVWERWPLLIMEITLFFLPCRSLAHSHILHSMPVFFVNHDLSVHFVYKLMTTFLTSSFKTLSAWMPIAILSLKVSQ